MSILVNINSVDKTNLIVLESLRITQNINEKVDKASFKIRSKVGSNKPIVNSKAFGPVTPGSI